MQREKHKEGYKYDKFTWKNHHFLESGLEKQLSSIFSGWLPHMTDFKLPTPFPAKIQLFPTLTRL